MDGHKYTALFEAPGGHPILHAYPDPGTGHTPWTIGLGHTGPDVHAATVWTEGQCWNAFYNDYAVAQGHAAQLIGTMSWAQLSEPRRAVLTDMAFNMGNGGLANFSHMLAAVRNNDWAVARNELLNSSYAHQTKTRAQTNAQTLLTGEWGNETS